MSTSTSEVTFIDYAIPGLKDDTYTIEVNQKVQIRGSDGKFVDVDPGVPTATAKFAVVGKRFTLDPSDVGPCFPADLSNGEFSGVLPHISLNRITLPWERNSILPPSSPKKSSKVKKQKNIIPDPESTPWLSVLLFNEDEVNVQPSDSDPTKVLITNLAEPKDLVDSSKTLFYLDAQGDPPIDSHIKGTLPEKYFSYSGMDQLQYGEFPGDPSKNVPGDPCSIIDIPANLFNKVLPSLNDLPYLAHVRSVDTTNSEDTDQQTIQTSIVTCNRFSKPGSNSHAFLVSLENLGEYLPSDKGDSNLPAGTTHVRLIFYKHWKFYANDQAQLLENLLENLIPPKGQPGSTLQSYVGPQPSQDEVKNALAAQKAGNLTPDQTKTLVINTYTMGYIPFPHNTRRAETMVSWYRGPLVPYSIDDTLSPFLPISSPDSANRYNPQTGMFDVSYGAAWQLGQLLALQSPNFSTALYNWKQLADAADVKAEENALLQKELFSSQVLNSTLKQRTQNLSAPTIPDEVVTWIASLRLLQGVPFNYLVPDEQMLPPESLRFFYVDPNWIEALVDGAFSIGRTTTGDLKRDAKHLSTLRTASKKKMRTLRRNPKPAHLVNKVNTDVKITGVLLRSRVVPGWPRLIINGYDHMDATPASECLKYKMVKLSQDVLIVLFEGDVVKVDIHEPPEQLHFGVEPNNATCFGLRAVVPFQYTSAGQPLTVQPGSQLIPIPTDNPTIFPDGPISFRSDTSGIGSAPQTIQLANTAETVLNILNDDYAQDLTMNTTFTNAEFALQMIQGVVQVEFQKY